MAGRKPAKPGPKPRLDAKQRERQVLFRMQDLYPDFDARAPHGNAAKTAKRDLRRYWTLVDHQLRNIDVNAGEVGDLAEAWLRSDSMVDMPMASTLPALMSGFAQTVGAASLRSLSVADATALADLFTRVETGRQAEQLLLDILQNG